MARRKRREGHSLHKVLGVGALFSTAYGNVGSSIYYALGVVAVAALGLTPAVFVITGVLFIATAWSYSEATAAMPEAGGASSFTRRAFNEFASFGIGWAQMLDLHGHHRHLGAVRAAVPLDLLADPQGAAVQRHRRRHHHHRPRRHQHRRHQGGGRASTSCSRSSTWGRRS